MKKPGLVMTIASDDEIEPEEDTDSESELAAAAAAKKPAAALTKAGKKRQRQKAAAAGSSKGQKGDGLVDPAFRFEVESNLGIAERQAVKGWDFKSEFCFGSCLVVRC